MSATNILVRARVVLFALCIIFSIFVFGLSVDLAPYYHLRAEGDQNVLDLIGALPHLSDGIPTTRRALSTMMLHIRDSLSPDEASSISKQLYEQYHSEAIGAFAATVILAIGSCVGFLWSIAAIVLLVKRNEAMLSVRRAGWLSIFSWSLFLVGSALYSAKSPYEHQCGQVNTPSDKKKCMVHNGLTVTMWLTFVLWTFLVVVLFLGRGAFASVSSARHRSMSASGGKVRYPFDSTVDHVQTSSDMEMANQPKHAKETIQMGEDPFAARDLPVSQQRELEVDHSPFADK